MNGVTSHFSPFSLSWMDEGDRSHRLHVICGRTTKPTLYQHYQGINHQVDLEK